MLTDYEEICANGELFAEWNRACSRSSDEVYKQHQVDVLEYWLESKIPGRGIGNLFRFDHEAEFLSQKTLILSLPEFESVNSADQNGRPLAALNRFGRYLVSLQAGRIDADIAAGMANVANRNGNIVRRAEPQTSRMRSNNARVINCLEGLIELIAGAGSEGMSEEEKLKLFARHMIQKSYFFRPESVNCRHQEILASINNNERVPVRFSTARGTYTEEDGSLADLVREVAIDASIQRRIMYNSFGRRIPVFIDRDNNREVRGIIERFSGARVSQGRLRSNIRAAIISHVWGNAYDPLCFTNLWNVVVIPDYINPIMEKEETRHPANFFERAVNFVKAYYKELCYKMYRLEEKIDEYERLGFNIRPLFVTAENSNVVEEADMRQLNFLEDLFVAN